MRRYQFVKLLVVVVLALTIAATVSSAKDKPLSDSAKAGEKIFQQNCALCHNANSAANKVGPGMKGLFERKDLPSSHKPVTVENVREQINKGAPNGKPLPMPAFANKLSKTQMDQLIEYLKSL